MNTTEYFKRTIQAYLEERAMEDELFAAKYDNPDKNIDDCVTYILNGVQKSGCNGFCDDEIYGQAIHYYEEKDIEVLAAAEGKTVEQIKAIISSLHEFNPMMGHRGARLAVT